MTVRHSRGEYEVSFTSLREAIASLPEDSFVFTDENVHRHWGEALGDLPTLALPPGESSKALSVYGACLEWLAGVGASRNATVIAFGGGVVGDLAGFVAATYMRGVRLVQIPTTLLSQVDSSVGGKVGLDLPQGKNLVGAFYPPQAVFISLETLDTLDERQFRAGAAEVWKMAAIRDEGLFTQLEAAPLTAGDARLRPLVERCVGLKAEFVQSDEFEITGERATLNFGHTVGHAIEVVTGYGPVLHGESVSIGMAVEARLGELVGITPTGTSERIRAGLTAQGLPSSISGISREDLLRAMRLDKKAKRGELAFALLTQIGGCKLVSGVSDSAVLEALGNTA